jgi:hypothetical protein
MMTGENSMRPCERFTVLESRKSDSLSRCDVCDHAEAAHETPGRRVLSGGAIEELRRQLLIENFDKREAEQPQSDAPT